MPDNDAWRQAEEQTRRLAWDPQLVPVLVDTKQRWSWWFIRSWPSPSRSSRPSMYGEGAQQLVVQLSVF
uniref:Uncharacterized protein n=1 Tax=Oryza meridionalis TaxID=40149 RepID=A0A0E0F0J7_9ORYZ